MFFVFVAYKLNLHLIILNLYLYVHLFAIIYYGFSSGLDFIHTAVVVFVVAAFYLYCSHQMFKLISLYLFFTIYFTTSLFYFLIFYLYQTFLHNLFLLCYICCVFYA